MAASDGHRVLIGRYLDIHRWHPFMQCDPLAGSICKTPAEPSQRQHKSSRLGPISALLPVAVVTLASGGAFAELTD